MFQYLVELEDKNLVKHLDHDGQQWTRVIIAAEEEDTHSSFLARTSDTHASLPCRSDSLQIDLGTVECLPSDDCHHHGELL